MKRIINIFLTLCLSIFLYSCATMLTPMQVNNTLPMLTKSTYLSVEQAQNPNCKCLTHESFNIEDISGPEKEFIDNKTENEVFLVYENLEATDGISARHNAEIPLERIANFFSFFHHKEKPTIQNKALVINTVDGFTILLDKPIKSIIKKEDIKPKEAVERVKSIFVNLDLPMDTLLRLSKAIDIHSIALETDEIENKLLNLWTAIETLIPKDAESDQDRIIQIIQGLMPFQCQLYLNNLIKQVFNDWYFFNTRNAAAILETVITTEPEQRINKILALFTTKENDPIRQNVYSQLNDFPLLRFRIYTINKHFGNGKSIKKLLNDHIQRVEWQIRRIYRVRNLIVHGRDK